MLLSKKLLTDMEEGYNEQSPVKDFSASKDGNFVKSVLAPALIIVALIITGGVSGYFLSGQTSTVGRSVGISNNDGKVSSGGVPKEAGVNNPSVYKDQAAGRLEENTNKDVPEGSHKLIRPGGDDQTAYLTSSVLDLDQFLGQCIEIWGQTYAAQKAGWLMDVGRVKLLDSCPEGL